MNLRIISLLGLATIILNLTCASRCQAVVNHHLMQIHQVIGGVHGDKTAQAVQLRMRGAFQNQMQNGKLWAFDAQGQNPVLLIDFGNSVPNSGAGVTVLVTSASFDAATDPATQSDFTFTNLIPESYLAAGSLTFENNAGTSIWWRVSWGGANYTGSTAGSLTNDDDGDFGVYPDPLPCDGAQALLYQGTSTSKSTNNADDYDLTAGAAIFENNAGELFTIVTPLCPQSGNVLEGIGEVGDFSETCASDDVYWGAHGTTFFYAVNDPVTQFELCTRTADLNPTSIEIQIEAKKAAPTANLIITAQLFNWTSGQYQTGSLPGTMFLGTTDSIRIFSLTGVPAEFVGPPDANGEGEVCVRFQTIQASGPANVRALIDDVQFQVNQ